MPVLGARVHADEAVECPRLGPFLGVIDAMLEADRQAPAKQRHTAKRIFERLEAEPGYGGGYTVVKDDVRERKVCTRDVRVFGASWGHAQVDFGEASDMAAFARRCTVHILEMNGESYRLKDARSRRRKAAKVESDMPTAEDTVDPDTGEITSD